MNFIEHEYFSVSFSVSAVFLTILAEILVFGFDH